MWLKNDDGSGPSVDPDVVESALSAAEYLGRSKWGQRTLLPLLFYALVGIALGGALAAGGEGARPLLVLLAVPGAMAGWAFLGGLRMLFHPEVEVSVALILFFVWIPVMGFGAFVCFAAALHGLGAI